MKTSLLIGAAGTVLAAGAVCVGGAYKLFKTVIPRQDGVKVDISEMADMARWEEYKKLIIPRSEWVHSQKLEHVWIPARDGIGLHGWYLPCEKPTDKLVIILHGYTSKGLDSAAHAYFFSRMGFDCIMPDHRAHGDSEGDYIGFGILDRFDCCSWIKYVRERFGKDKKILLHGTSMGATTALMAAAMPEAHGSVKGVISDCAFTSPYDVFSHILKRDYHLPKFPIMNINSVICRKKAGYGFKDCSTLDAVKNIKCPVLFIHGSEDNFVPTSMTFSNYNACTAPKYLLIVENAGHGASYYENMEQYEEAERDFIDQCFQNEEGEQV